MSNKFVSFVKAHVVGPVTVAASAALAPLVVGGSLSAIDYKAVGLAFVGALVGAVLHKKVIVKVVGED